jgi:dihydroorotate dehydrogenase electron transfer subunit
LPGINEKPFSISGHDKNGTFVTIRRRGSFSAKLVDLKEGDRVGVRGPYGRPFELTENC